MIIAHLADNTRSLLACSLTCYSWYIAAVPRLHRTLITPTYHWYRNEKFVWPKPLLYMRELGLLPLVKEFQVHTRRSTDSNGFSPELFNRSILCQFSALTNVQELGIDYLDIPKFMPDIRQYFGHFLPTVRSLALREPRGSHRQIIYFIGLFPHMDDLKLLYGILSFQEEPTSDLTLVPPFAPPLRGRLTMNDFESVGFLEDMIDLFGGIRFYYMDLFEVDEMRLLLDACAETLEILRLYPTNSRGETSLDGMRALADDSPALFPLENINLSQNKSLRVLEVTASSVLGGKSNFLTHALSTIISPVFSEVVILYRDCDFRGVECSWSPFPRAFRLMSDSDIVEEASWHHKQFKLFHRMHRVRGFRLVLCADVWDRVAKYTVQVLKQAVAAEKVKGGFGGHFSEPLVVYTPRGSPPEHSETSCADSPNP